MLNVARSLRAILLTAGLLWLGTASAWAFANPTTNIFINEIHYDNTGTDAGEAIEVAGPAGIDLTGWSLVLYNGANGLAYATTALSGTIPDQQGGFGTVSVSYVVNGIQNGAPDGIALVNASSTVVQFLSYEGTLTAADGPANGMTSTDIGVSESGSDPIGQSLQLSGTGTTYGAFVWNTPAAHTFGSINTGQSFGGADTAPTVSATSPGNGTSDAAVDTDISVTFSEAVNVSGVWFNITCGSSGAHTAAVSGGPTTFTLDPSTDFALGESCTVTILAAGVSDQDTNDPPDNMAADYSWSFSTTAVDVCTLPYTPIYAIQGSGLAVAITGVVTTKGVVVGDFEGSASLGGFYIQDLAGDGDAATSDGLFVYTGTADLVSVGQVVRVTGYARERFNQTTLNGSNSNSSAVPAANIVQCGTGSVPATDVLLPFADADGPERYEGMAVRLPQALVISEYFNYDRFGEIVLALPLDGEARPFTGTAIDQPGAAANARTLANSLRRITLDDANSAQNPSVLRHPNGLPFSLSNRFRGGDTVHNTVGVLGFDFSLYRIFPTGPADYTALNPRPAVPDPVGGTRRVAAINTFNFFVTADYPTGNPLDNQCGPLNNVECRGWDSDQVDEFTRQRTKLLAALSGLDADIIGLTELENTAGVEPLADIVAGLPGYAYVDTGTIGTDAIKVGLIYRTARVALVGAYQILDSTDDPRFLDTKNRPSLAQTFQDLSTGGRFTVVVNHFKSKGSDCNDVGDPDTGDGQGNCNGTRALAAQALMDWLATDPTGSGDPDVIIIGDLNSYAMEDPIDVITAGADDTVGTSDDFTNLISAFQGPYTYSYVFDGQFGYLDHALASSSLLAQVTGAAQWHINADEPDVLDYDTSFKSPEQDALYEPNGYRSSDHDPVVVGLSPLSGATALEITGTFYDDNGAPTRLSAKLSGEGGCDAGGKTVKFYVDLNGDGDFTDTPDELVGTGVTDASGTAQYSWDASSSPAWAPGIWEVKAVFEGAPNCLPSDDTTTISIVQRGDAANGGGWYQYKTVGSPRVNYGFTVRKQRDGSYKGQLVWHNNGKWRIKGTLTTFGRTAPCTYAGTGGVKCGSSLGTGKLYSWNGGTLTWDYVQDVSYVISFVDGGSSKKGGAKPDYFGINVTDFSNPSLPESAPQQLKGGNVSVP